MSELSRVSGLALPPHARGRRLGVVPLSVLW